MNFKFKRLMFLGATSYQLPAIKKAKELGCSVITVSNDLSQIGHSFSELCLDISTIDKNLILKAAKEYKIDAIMTYAANAAVETVAYVAEKLNLPGNPLQSSKILQNKGLFRELQNQINLPHPEFILVKTIDKLDEVKDLVGKCELIVKPIDSGGSCGQSMIKNFDEAEGAFFYAKENSMLGEVIFEEKIHSTMLELDGDVFFQKGKLAFSLYGHN